MTQNGEAGTDLTLINKMNALCRKRRTLNAKCDTFRDYVDLVNAHFQENGNLSIEMANNLDSRRELFSPILTQFEEVQTEIDTVESVDFDEQLKIRATFEHTYFELLAVSKKLSDLRMIKSKEVELNHGNSIHSQSHVQPFVAKLPQINLPTFDGTLDEWLEFRDTFISLIHDTPLGDMQKYHYLRAAVKGTAGQVIRSIPFSTPHYVDAWNSLRERYDNEPLLIQNHVKALINLTPIHKESSREIRTFYDAVLKHINALKTLHQPVEQWDTLLNQILLAKFDKCTLREWESSRDPKSLATFDQLREFLKKRAEMLENLDSCNNKESKPERKSDNKSAPKMSYSVQEVNPSCTYCNKSHTIYNCPELAALSVNCRFEHSKKSGLCINCLKAGHISKNCKSMKCRKCKSSHHTLLHYERVTSQDSEGSSDTAGVATPVPQQSRPPSSNHNASIVANQYLNVLLSTAQVCIADKNGQSHTCRALLDSGAQSNFITSAPCQKLELVKESVNTSIVGINQVASSIPFKCTASIQSSIGNYSETVSCLIMDRITSPLPSAPLDLTSIKIPAHVKLADPKFNIPGEVDMLIGAGIFWNLLCVGQFKLAPNGPLMQKTKLGWVVTGHLPCTQLFVAQSHCGFTREVDLREQLERFWLIEELPKTQKSLTPDEIACKNSFRETTKRDKVGRFVVRIPLKADPSSLGDSQRRARNRLFALERKFIRNPLFPQQYVEFLREYERLGHMVKASPTLAQLAARTIKALAISKGNCFLWSDSTVVLHWINTHSALLQTFVSNRVSLIQESSQPRMWNHVSSADNPADLLSRGTSPSDLVQNNLWWQGTTWLKASPEEWPIKLIRFDDLQLAESREPRVLVTEVQSIDFPFDAFSSLTRIKRVTAHCIRFARNTRNAPHSRHTSALTSDELQHALLVLARMAQKDDFRSELRSLQDQRPLESHSKLRRLTPFLDSFGLIRVGGRLMNSAFCYDKKFPIVLSSSHILTKLLMLHEHNILGHAGPQLLLASLRDLFWPLSGRSVARKIVHGCVTCSRMKPRVINPLMGHLPIHRTTTSPPFSVTGVDYFGPVAIKDRIGRGCKVTKGYVALFVCFAVKAVHLELVTDLSTNAFLAALRRFTARRGKPSHIHSDNGRNFVGANAELKGLSSFFARSGQDIGNSLANDGITWHFTPPYSPNFGGLWEAGVKSSKHHMLRILRDRKLTYEQFATVLNQVEAILNSRPITPLSSDPNDLEALTPGHFLIGRRLTAVPDPDVTGIVESRLSKFQQLQALQQHFWVRWSREYVSELQTRSKWNKSDESLEVGDLVLIKNENQPPLYWKLGRVIALHPGKDNVSRVASVKTSNGVVKRSVRCFCPLPQERQ